MFVCGYSGQFASNSAMISGLLPIHDSNGVQFCLIGTMLSRREFFGGKMQGDICKITAIYL